MSARRLTAGFAAALLVGALTACTSPSPAPATEHVQVVQAPTVVTKTAPPVAPVPQPATVTDRAGLLVIDPWALTPTAPLDGGQSVITQTAAVTGAPGALVYDTPGGTIIGVLPSQTLASPTVVPVVETRYDGAWLRVQLPSRLALPSSGLPVNGATGWVSSTEVTLADVGSSVVVDLAARTISVLGAVTFTAEVGIGTAETPTPVGRGYLASVVLGSATSPRVLALSMHSGVLDEYAADPAVIGIHTTTLVSSGAVSNGCIRASDAVLDVVDQLPPGTPITITNEGV